MSDLSPTTCRPASLCAMILAATLLAGCASPDASPAPSPSPQAPPPPRPTDAQCERPTGSFDLLVWGRSLNERASQVQLRANPSEGHAWTTLGPPAAQSRDGRLLLWTDLSLGRYLGHDIRENHLLLRVQPSSASGSDAALRAVYAVPHTAALSSAPARRLRQLVRQDPLWVRTHSYASYVRPRPLSLSKDAPVVRPVEAPVRHCRPGVLEVRWLEMLYQQGQ